MIRAATATTVETGLRTTRATEWKGAATLAAMKATLAQGRGARQQRFVSASLIRNAASWLVTPSFITAATP